MERAFFFFIAVALAFAVGCWGSSKKIGFTLAFVLSILNIFVGIVAVLLSKKLD